MAARPRIRLLALDVDGTLLDARHRVTPAVRRAVQEVAGLGVEVVLASARGPGGLQPILRALDLRGCAVAFSGALRCRIGPGLPAEPLGGDRMELEAAREVARLGRALGVTVGWWDAGGWTVEALDGPAEHEARVIELPPRVGDLCALLDAPFKLQCMVPLDAVGRLEALQRACPATLSATFSNVNYLEIVRAGVDKATGLRKLGEALGVALAEMAAIGDGENDLAMLAEAGVGIAMGNARPAVKAAAAWTTAGHDEDGVAVAVERLRREGWM